MVALERVGRFGNIENLTTNQKKKKGEIYVFTKNCN
jgi:hypothetical protein